MSDDDVSRMRRQQILQQANRVVDPQLRRFFDELSLRIWRSADPVATLQALLYGESARGAPRGNHAYRDFFIGAKVAWRMRHGQKRDAACAAVAERSWATKSRDSPKHLQETKQNRDGSSTQYVGA